MQRKASVTTLIAGLVGLILLAGAGCTPKKEQGKSVPPHVDARLLENLEQQLDPENKQKNLEMWRDDWRNYQFQSDEEERRLEPLEKRLEAEASKSIQDLWEGAKR